MPLTPFGGLSLVINVIVVALGLSINLFKKDHLANAFISHKHIFKLESTKIGKVCTPIIALMIPLFIFMSITVISFKEIQYLYDDAHKVTFLSLGAEGFDAGVSQYTHLLEKKENKSVPQTTPQKKLEGVVLGANTSTQALYSVDFFVAVDEAFNRMVEKWVLEGPKASTTFLLFSKGKNEKKLMPFLQANGLPTSLEDRNVMALFFGIEAYNGSEKQNNLLRKKLGEITSNQLSSLSKVSKVFTNNN